jgi:heterodisulfide reductase subunit B
VLIRAQQAGADKLVTLCAQCYNTLARANRLVREDEEKRKTLNDFMTEEPDYNGEVEVIHLLQLLRDELGWEKLREKVKKPLEGLKVGPVYGCTLLRPQEVGIDSALHPTILQEFISALGASPVEFAASNECCGAYEVLVDPEAGLKRTRRIVDSANQSGVDALILSCPLCEYNIGKQQKALESDSSLPVFYFSQLLAMAMGLDAENLRLELNAEGARELVKERKLAAGA